MDRSFKPRLPQVVSFVTSGELEVHEPSWSSPLVITSSRVQWNAPLLLIQGLAVGRAADKNAIQPITSFAHLLAELLLSAPEQVEGNRGSFPYNLNRTFLDVSGFLGFLVALDCRNMVTTWQ